MTLSIVLQAFVLPVIAALFAAVNRRLFPIILAIAFWGISLWIKGFTLEAMDSVAASFSIAALTLVSLHLFPTLKKRWLAVTQLGILLGLSVWQVKNFASSISGLAWAIQFSILLFMTLLPWIQRWPEQVSDGSFLSRYRIEGLFWLVPVGYLSILSPIAGSLLVGQIAGLIALFGLSVWCYQGWYRATVNDLALLIATPTLFVAQMAWHYVEIPWTSLLIGLLGWLPLLIAHIERLPAVVKLILVVVVFGALTGTGLYLEWPEKSLY